MKILEGGRVYVNPGEPVPVFCSECAHVFLPGGVDPDASRCPCCNSLLLHWPLEIHAPIKTPIIRLLDWDKDLRDLE